MGRGPPGRVTYEEEEEEDMGAGVPNNAPGLTVIHQKTSQPGPTVGPLLSVVFPRCCLPLPLPGWLSPSLLLIFHPSVCLHAWLSVLLSARTFLNDI